MAITRIRRLFDLDADSRAIDDNLASNAQIAPLVRHYPGLRLAGTANPNETVIRSIVGQQITMKAATEMLSQMADGMPDIQFGGPVSKIFPTPEYVEAEGHLLLPGPLARRNLLKNAAGMIASSDSLVHIGQDQEALVNGLLSFSGIGPWTANCIAIRTLGAPDILLPGDSAIAASARSIGIQEKVADFAKEFRPWRSYLTIHLWNRAAKAVC